nr:cold shock domain-containing protein [Pedobacter kyonggii]
MRKGTVIQIDQSVGFGFIQDENEQEIAFCLANLTENITSGDLVEFKIELMAHGLTATNLRLLLLI